jgi:hypothetical protein
VILCAAFAALLWALPLRAQVNVEFGEPDFNPQTTSIPGFISNLYVFALAIGGIIAVGAIVVGGVMYISEGAIPQKKTEGKTIILGALWGLGLLLGAYVILRTVNPELVTLDVATLQDANFKNCSDMTELPYCAENPPQAERDKDGNCVCRKKSPLAQCPGSVKIPPQGSELPTFEWTKESGNFPNENTVLEWDSLPDISSADGCPQKVKILPGTTPYFVTSVNGGKFVMDLTKQPKDLGFSAVSFPLPEGYTYTGNLTPRHVSGDPGKAICLLNSISVSGNGVAFVYRHPDSSFSGTNLCAYGNFSDEVTNTASLEIKKGGEGNNLDCRVGTGLCAPANLQSQCSTFAGNLEKMSKICVMESSENPAAVSESDFCKNEASLPKNERHPFSLGLFQINVISNKEHVRAIYGDAAANLCAGLYTGETTLVDRSRPRLGYKCEFKGTAANWLTCRALLSQPNPNIKVACRIHESQGIGAWQTSANKCDL